MWTGGKPPLIPVVVTPASSSSKQKNVKVNAELAALKERGLAKILNKHFTETATQLATEKAAADAACRDLAERKARTSEFTASTSTELSPLDAACVKANQWRAECRRKERETLLLYQRYVHKFGNTIAALPLVPVTNHTSSTTRAAATAPPPTLKPVTDGSFVPSMAKQIEATLEEYLKHGGIQHPSVMTYGKDVTYQSVAAKEEAIFRDYYRRQLERDYLTRKQSKQSSAQAQDKDVFCGGTGNVDVFTRSDIWKDHIEAAVAAAEAAALDHIHSSVPIVSDDNNNDEEMYSVVSGLTTLHSAMTRELLQDCERSVQTFLKEEQAYIRQIMDEEGASHEESAENAEDSHACVQDSVQIAAQAETMVQQMQDILLEYQSKQNTAANASAAAASRAARPYPTSNSEEDWMIYYDEFYQQEYYHEKNSNRTQWEPPTSHDSSLSNSSSTDAFTVIDDYDDTLVGSSRSNAKSGTAATSRVAAYRRSRRKQRRRRRNIFLMLLTLLGSAATAYYLCHREQHNATCLSVQDAIVQKWHQLTDVKKVKHHADASQNQLVKEEPQQRPQPDDSFLFFMQQHDDEHKEGAQCMAVEEESRRNVLMQRPWACNLPFAYLFHSRCRRLATQNPVFDLHALIHSMLQ